MYSFSEQLFLEVFMIEIQQGIYDETRFKRYLDLAPRGYYSIPYTESRRKTMEGKKKSYDSFWESVYGRLNQYWYGDEVLIRNFLTEIFKKA